MIRYGIRRLCLAAAMSVLCLIGSWAQAQSFSIGSNGFSATNVCSSANVTQGCQVATNGNAAEVPAGKNTPSLLRLTPALSNQTGSAWYVSTQPFASGFDTQFQFQLNGGAGGADGIAFVIQSAGLSAIGFTGGNGGALGYGGDDFNQSPLSGIPHSVAIEFDTFQNGWDPDANHVAIQSCGANPNTSHHNVPCPSQPNIANATIGLATSQIALTGAPHLAEIKYVVVPAPPGCEQNCVSTTTLTISIDGNEVLSANVDLTAFLGQGPAYVGFTGGTGDLNNNQDILSWSYLATQQSTPQPTSGGTTNTFIFNGNTGDRVQHSLAFPIDAQPPDFIDLQTLTIQSSNNLVSDSAVWPEYVVGTPFGPSHCFVKPGDVLLSGGTDTCSLYEDVCSDKNNGPSESNCPVVPPSSPNSIHITDLWDAPTGKVQIAPGTTAALIHFFPSQAGEAWNPFGSIPEAMGVVNPACTDPTSSTSPAPPNACDLSNLDNFALTSDPTSSGNTKRKGKFISAYNIPMLETTVTANGTPANVPGVQGSTTTWVNTSTVNLNFLVNPAQAPPAPNNNFSAAPVNQFTYGLTDPTGTTILIPDTLLQAADLTHAAPVNFNVNTPVLADGTYRLHWFSLDNVKIKEQNIQLVSAVAGSCPDGSPSASGSCYATNLFNALIGVDTQAPSITLITPPGPQPLFPSANYAANSTVYASYSCNDGNGSGYTTCAGPVPSGKKIDTKPTGGISTTKTFTVTSTDFAGNASTATATYYVSCHYVQFGVSPTTVARGGTVKVTTSVMDCKSSNQKLTVQLQLSGPLGKNCSNTILPVFSLPLTVPAGTSKSFSFPVTIPKCQCGGTFTLTTTTLVNQVQVDRTSTSLTVQ
ncbi:MAG TPA: L-type lectin-domain containing protein [Terriglobales bacterium]|jgi:hypothetical protein|nr:L-type lectin-domain containing protein [Terriglobales bacterium]